MGGKKRRPAKAKRIRPKYGPRLIKNPEVVLRAMGDDLVVVNERAGKLAVINSTGRLILDAILRGGDDKAIKSTLEALHTFEAGVNLQHEIDATRSSLIDIGLLVPQRPYVASKVVIRDLKSALKDMDLSRSTVSQYE